MVRRRIADLFKGAIRCGQHSAAYECTWLGQSHNRARPARQTPPWHSTLNCAALWLRCFTMRERLGNHRPPTRKGTKMVEAEREGANGPEDVVIALVDDDRNILTTVSIALQAEGFVTRLYSEIGRASGRDRECKYV